MSDPMRQMKKTAQAHLQRDMNTARQWICTCDDCREIRSLMGMDKLLGVWPLVRQIQDTAQQLDELPDGTEKEALRKYYEKLQDELAATMAQ